MSALLCQDFQILPDDHVAGLAAIRVAHENELQVPWQKNLGDLNRGLTSRKLLQVARCQEAQHQAEASQQSARFVKDDLLQRIESDRIVWNLNDSQ